MIWDKNVYDVTEIKENTYADNYLVCDKFNWSAKNIAKLTICSNENIRKKQQNSLFAYEIVMNLYDNLIAVCVVDYIKWFSSVVTIHVWSCFMSVTQMTLIDI